MLSTTSASRKNKSLPSTKWVKLTFKISHFFGSGTWTKGKIAPQFLEDSVPHLTYIWRPFSVYKPCIGATL